MHSHECVCSARLTGVRCAVRAGALAFVVAVSIVVSRPLFAQRIQLSLAITVRDSVTGLPVADVEVVALRTRISAVTARNGTAVLTLVDGTEALIRLRRIGYRPLTLWVATTNRDSSRTVFLVPLPQPVSEVVTAGRAGTRHRGPADTLRTLELNGFYERRRRTVAPASAFVTEEKLSRLTTLEDLRHLTGRGLCVPNLYVDGMRVRVDRSFYSWLRPDRVAGIELYTHAPEIPALYNVTLPSGSTSACATVIWTK